MERYQLKNHGTVIDTKTGLQWEAKYSGPMNWKSAMDLPAKLNAERFGGHDDWRLPPIEELFSLVDSGKLNPASEFPGIESVSYWSSSPYAGGSPLAWYVYFNFGYVNYDDVSYTLYARCVRGGPLD